MTNTVTNCFFSLNDHGLLLVRGPDAIKFLQGQVTCDITSLSSGLSCLGAHCTHKGRMLFSFRACQLDEQTIALKILNDLLPNALNALKKYSVFSKVELINARDDYTLIGFSGNEISRLQAITSPLPIPADNNHTAVSEEGVIIRINDSRYEYWLPSRKNADMPEDLGTSDQWTALDIADGIGEVRPETVETFIPQMLNLQVIGGGISFSKGCYTGQEIVARMQYLGKLKRRMYRFKLNSTQSLLAGAPVFTTNSAQVVGEIVSCAPVNNGQELLAVVKEDAFASNELYIDEDYQYKLEALPLPYAITKE